MSVVDSQTELSSLLEKWDRESNSPGISPALILKRICELIEKEMDAYFKMDPDPFDDRHPGRADPKCGLGHLLKTLFRHQDLTNKIVREYLLMPGQNEEVQVNACRLLLDMLPALESNVLTEDSSSTNQAVKHLLEWAETGKEPLRSYATGLLPAAMELQDMAANYREENARLVPIMLQRLWTLLEELIPDCREKKPKISQRPFADIGSLDKEFNGTTAEVIMKSPVIASEGSRLQDSFNECSNSSWAEMEPYVIGGEHKLEPLTLQMKLRLIVLYLTPMAEYQELISHMFENNALQIIFNLIDLDQNRDIRLAFDALKFLSSLLCHKKFAMEFISEGGVEYLLRVVRPSVAATGVSMCLYYLAYFEDAMERVCLLPHHVLADLVSYALWLLECSHDSGRCHAAMCLSASFQFRVILDLFDAKDGLRRLFNMMSTLKILSLDDNEMTSEDEAFLNRQSARHVCVGLKRYFEAHLAIKAEELRRSQAGRNGRQHIPSVPAYKAAKYSPEVFQEYMELMLESHPLRIHWKPVSDFLKLDGVTLLLQLIAMAAEWHNYTGKVETIRSALDVLAICMVSPKPQLQLLNMLHLPDSVRTPGVNIILGVADGEIPGISDPDIQRAALTVLINCVCGPESRVSGALSRYNTPVSARKRLISKPDETLVKMWEGVRSNNGIMLLLKLLHTKTPITAADSIRAMACRALSGLSRDEKVLQIMSKLPMFNNGQLQLLIKEPILQDKRAEYVRFCRYATELIERMSGTVKSYSLDTSVEALRRADIVAQTRITFHEHELLILVHEHLMSKGLYESAHALQLEANLPQPVVKRTESTTPHPPNAFSPSLNRAVKSPINTPRSLQQFATPSSSHASPNMSNHVLSRDGSCHAQSAAQYQPIRVNIIKPKVATTPGTPHNPLKVKLRINREPPTSAKDPDTTVTLNGIVKEYLRKQHSLCPNPTSVCPPFSLLKPHQCPVPSYRSSAPKSLTARVMRRQLEPRFGGHYGARHDREYIYSRFRPFRSYHDQEDDTTFSCCAFTADEQSIILGTYSGELKVYSLPGGDELMTSEVHNSPVSFIQPSRDGKFLLTSSTWGTPQSALWQMTQNDLNEKLTFVDDNHIQFSNISQDKIVGTKSERANLYDTRTGALLNTFYDAAMANNYTKNMATLGPTDDLLLSDGVLWDVRSGKLIHKFDKFNPSISGLFDPTGLEIIINTEVWDIRSFSLLHTVPTLDQCHIHFNTAGTVIYAANYPQEEMDDLDNEPSPLCSSFRTYDATTYTNIATVDVKRHVVDLCTDQSDCYLAAIENTKSSDSLTQESVCRLYEVGQLRDEEDDQNEEIEENESDDEEAQESDDDDEMEIDMSGDEDDDVLDLGNGDGDGEGDEDDYETVSSSSSDDPIVISDDNEELTLSSDSD